jgi:hypothetical protein
MLAKAFAAALDHNCQHNQCENTGNNPDNQCIIHVEPPFF